MTSFAPPRAPLFAVDTPVPGFERVTLYLDTWQDHVVSRHPELQGREEQVRGILIAPTLVCRSTSEESRAIFLRRDILSPKGSPLLVIVDRQALAVCTAYFNRSFQPGATLWVPQ